MMLLHNAILSPLCLRQQAIIDLYTNIMNELSLDDRKHGAREVDMAVQ